MPSSCGKMHPAPVLYSSSFGEMLGGGQQSLLLLLRNLDRARFAPLLCVPAAGGLQAAAEAGGIPVRFVPTPRLRDLRPGTVGRFLRLLREEGIRLVHTDAPRQALSLGLAARLTGIPHVWHVRVGNPEPLLLEMLLYLLASRVLAVSAAAARRFAGFSRGGKVRVVHNSVDLERFHPGNREAAAREELGGDDRLIIATVGQVTPGKGQDVFLEAAALAQRQLPRDLRFAVVGAGEPACLARLRTRAMELGIGEETVFTGFREDVPRLMAAADVVVLYTTFVEGFSRVVIEAMASGCPVVTTALGGNREALQDGVEGYLLPPDRRPEPLAEAMVRLAADAGLRRTMGEAARRRAAGRFGVTEQVRRIEALYEDLLAGR